MTILIPFDQIISFPAIINSKLQKIKLLNVSLLFVIYIEAQESKYYDLYSTLNFFVI